MRVGKKQREKSKNTNQEKGMKMERRDRETEVGEIHRMRPSKDFWVFRTAELCISAPLILLLGLISNPNSNVPQCIRL